MKLPGSSYICSGVNRRHYPSLPVLEGIIAAGVRTACADKQNGNLEKEERQTTPRITAGPAERPHTGLSHLDTEPRSEASCGPACWPSGYGEEATSFCPPGAAWAVGPASPCPLAPGRWLCSAFLRHCLPLRHASTKRVCRKRTHTHTPRAHNRPRLPSSHMAKQLRSSQPRRQMKRVY